MIWRTPPRRDARLLRPWFQILLGPLNVVVRAAWELLERLLLRSALHVDGRLLEVPRDVARARNRVLYLETRVGGGGPRPERVLRGPLDVGKRAQVVVSARTRNVLSRPVRTTLLDNTPNWSLIRMRNTVLSWARCYLLIPQYCIFLQFLHLEWIFLVKLIKIVCFWLVFIHIYKQPSLVHLVFPKNIYIIMQIIT